jgi:hypothetical protein
MQAMLRQQALRMEKEARLREVLSLLALLVQKCTY